MRAGRAFTGGVLGAAVMTALAALARRRGVAIDFEAMLGTLAGGEPTPPKRRAGLAIQLLNGGVLAQPYAAVFDRTPHAPAWAVGAVLGLVHTLAAGTLLAVVPMIHPEVPRRLPEPGPFYARQGAAAVGMLLLTHLVYGAVVGAVYGWTRPRKVRT